MHEEELYYEQLSIRYPGKAGHNILVCVKLIADQAAAKSDGTHNKKIAEPISTRVTEDMEEETGFTCYPAITRTLIPVKQLEVILKNPTISTSNLNVFTAGSQSNLSPTDVILDTGANCSIVHNSQLLSNMSTCNPVTFDGLSGSINIRSLGSICDAYYHTDFIANILSVSAITSQGHIHAYDNTADSFSISYPGGLLYLHSPGVTMDYMYVTLVIHMLL